MYVYICICACIIYIYCKMFTNWARLKNMLVWCHPGLFFRVHPAGLEKKLSFCEMEKIGSILIYNTFVTKHCFFFFRNEDTKVFLSHRFFQDPLG